MNSGNAVKNQPIANSFRPAEKVFRAIFRHPGLVLALGVYILLAATYFFIVPIFEGPDEWTHTNHVKYIAQDNGLPVMLPGRGIWGGQQPPLYYAVGALLVQPFELDGVEEYEESRRNPHAAIGYALDPGNKNNYLHRPSENFPYRGLSLTVHVLRLYSMVYGIISVVFIYLTAFEFAAHQVKSGALPVHLPFIAGRLGPHVYPARLFAAAVALFVACQPMFAFITASVANEPPNIAFSAVGLWLAQRYVLNGPTPRPLRAAALGITLGLISLSKMTGLSFGLVAVVAMLITAIATRKTAGAARLLWRDGVIIGTLFLAVGGWWYWRNYQLYGDFFQRGLYKIYFHQDPQPLTLSDFLYTLSTGEVSFWATFGWLNIAAPEWVYSFYRIISRVGLAGVGIAAAAYLLRRPAQPARRPEKAGPGFPAALILHLVFPVALAFSLTRLVATEGGLQGRQLLPALGAMAMVITWGWWAITPHPIKALPAVVLPALMFGVAVWLPFRVVAPAYIPRPFLAETDLPADLNRLNWTYGDGEIKLIGVKINAQTVRPGERVPVTAYWQALKPMQTNYSVFVHLFGRDYTNVGLMNTYPGLGLRPTSTLQPGQIVADTYPVTVNGGSKAPTRLQVNIGLFNFNEPGRPGIRPVTDAGLHPDSPTVGQLKLVPAEWPRVDVSQPPVADFGNRIRLANYAIKGCQARHTPCQITFTWLATGRPAADYTVFIQLWRSGRQATGFDAPPLSGDYPTGLWEANEVIVDPHPLDLSAVAPGRYRVVAGLYNFATGERVPVTANGQAVPDNALELGVLQVN